MDNLGEIKNQSLFEELGLVDTMGGSLTQNGLKGNVKIHKIYPEIWRNNSNKNECIEINYYNTGGYNIKSEYLKNKICVRTSKFKYKKGMLVSEITKDLNDKILSHCEFTYHENQKIKSSKVKFENATNLFSSKRYFIDQNFIINKNVTSSKKNTSKLSIISSCFN